MEDLNPEQKEAVLHVEGPLLILAGAGSGKTRVVSLRIVNLIKEGIDPRSVLGVTFTNKAAAEMKERVGKMIHHPVLITTFHSLGARILRESIYELGFSSHFTIYDEDDQAKIIKASLVELNIKEKRGDVRIIKNLISQAKNEMKRGDELELEEGEFEHLNEFERIFNTYQNKLKLSEALDFDDLLYLPVLLFKEKPHVLERYQERWRYLLVDEYQDTNQAQYELLKLLSGNRQNLFVVGDPDQSIYSWRGANIDNILRFETDFKGAKVIRLEQNYRSTTTILEAANSLISNNFNRLEKNLSSNLGEGTKIRTFTAYNEREEASFIAKEIDSLNERGIPLKDMVVFYRTNAQSRPFEDQFLSRSLPYKITGGISFYQRKEIKDILSFLRLIVQPADTVSFNRTVNLPKRGLGDATLEKIGEAAFIERMPILLYADALVSDAPLTHKLKLNPKIAKGLSEFTQLMNRLRAFATEHPLHEIVKETIEASGYMGYLKEDDPDSFQDRKENLDELIAKAWEYNADEEKSLSLFLEELSLKTNEEEDIDSNDQINLMTIHNGKGLEYKIVFIAGLEEDLFPHINSKKDPSGVEEERRLCYVGMTRAKERLYLTHCHIRYLWGVERDQRPSRFIKEISSEYLQKIR